MSPLMIPIIVFALVVVIVAVKDFTALHDREVEVQTKMQSLEIEHQRKMLDLNHALDRARRS